MSDSLAALTLADFPIITQDKLRYGDTDRQGHVNNAVYATFFETGRVELISLVDHHAPAPDTEFVVAKLSITYLQEVLWPGTVDVGTRIQRVGNSSLTVEQALFVDGEVAATAEGVIVQIDTQSRSASPLTQEARDYFHTLR